MQLYDLHTHTTCSHDGKQDPDTLCRTAVSLQMAGVAVTDHADLPYLSRPGALQRLADSFAEADRCAKRYVGQLEVLRGVELGEECWAREAADTVRALGQYDIILASVHGYMRDGKCIYYAQEPFDAAHYSDAALTDFLRRYFDDMAENAATADYDVLAHLTCPVRYIEGKWHRAVRLDGFADVIDDILRTVIRRDKTLEVNTSGMATDWGCRMPQEELLRRYYALGGHRVCMGSDAHVSERLGVGLPATAALLQRIGFAGQTVYRRRTPVLLPWEE